MDSESNFSPDFNTDDMNLTLPIPELSDKISSENVQEELEVQNEEQIPNFEGWELRGANIETPEFLDQVRKNINIKEDKFKSVVDSFFTDHLINFSTKTVNERIKQEFLKNQSIEQKEVLQKDQKFIKAFMLTQRISKPYSCDHLHRNR